MNAKQKVLRKLKKKGSKGITVNDFPTGFRLSARIKDLREARNDIQTIMEQVSDNCKIGRYFFIN